MHIIYFFTFGYSLETWEKTGTLSRELELYKLLADLNYKITFVTYGNLKDVDLIKHKNINVVPIYTLINKSPSKVINYLKSFMVPFILKNRIIKPDIIKQNQLLGSWLSIIYKLLTNKPLYVRTGYNMHEFAIYEGKSFFKIYIYKTLTKTTLKFCDIYSVTSNSDIDFMKKNYNLKYLKKIKLRKNWVKPIEHTSFKNRLDSHILMVGRLEKQKNYAAALNLMQNLPFTLDIVGDGNLRNEIEQLAQESNIKIRFFERLENERLINFYKNYKIYLTTSSFEGNPKTVLEAMSAGCVVFANNITNIEEIFISNDGVLFDITQNNISEIQNKFIEIDSNSNLFNKYSKAASNNVLINNSITKLLELTIKDFKNISI